MVTLSTPDSWAFFCNCPTFQQGNLDYNAYEKDIAIVNIFFGESTVFGEETSKKYIDFT